MVDTAGAHLTHQIETALRHEAPKLRQLQRILTINDGERLDLVFIVREPLYDAESEVIPLFQQALSLEPALQLDFVVIPERISAELESQAGARVLYEHRPGPPRQGEA